MKSLQEVFPRASKSFLDANPHPPVPTVAEAQKNALQPIVATRRGVMNKTETEFSMILEAQKRRGEITRWEFEPMTLRFAGVKYTPDFIVFYPDPIKSFRLIEVKGAWTKGKFERAVERFRHARTFFHEWQFQLWQKTKDGWGTPRI